MTFTSITRHRMSPEKAFDDSQYACTTALSTIIAVVIASIIQVATINKDIIGNTAHISLFTLS